MSLLDRFSSEFTVVAPRASFGVTGLGVSSELRGNPATGEQVVRYTGQVGAIQGRLDRSLDGELIKGQLGLGLNLPDIPTRSVDIVGSLFGGMFFDGSGAGFSGSVTIAGQLDR